MAEARLVCLDLDTFFVSVERRFRPELHGMPVIVGGGPGKRGVVTSCSYEVRPQGVRSGMPIAKAIKLAPDAVVVPTRHGVYGPIAKQVREILERFTPAVQTASIDEFFLDFRGCERLWHRPGDIDADSTILRVVREMRQTIQRELSLPASAGIGSSKPVAKIASGRAKPAGVRMVRVGEELAFLSPLPVRAYPGIGPVAAERLQTHGIDRLGQLLALPEGPLRARFGKLAASIGRQALPIQSPERSAARQLSRDRPKFREHDDPSQGTVGSISNERTFASDLHDRRAVLDRLRKLVERVCWRARQRGVEARTVTLKVRTSDFKTLQRAISGAPTTDERYVFRRIHQLLIRAWDGRRGVRLVGVALSNFVDHKAQLELPLSEEDSPPRVNDAVDAVRERFGYESIGRGARMPDRTRRQAKRLGAQKH
ncbi:MAG: DNA polymerase IV [Myxococcota bacterium]